MRDPIEHLPEGAKAAGDIAASMGAVVTVLSHWALTLTPILTFLIALATLAWWILRFYEKWRTGA